MGAGGSKQSGPVPGKHVFSSETPIQFSQDFVRQLQSSSETDASRAQSLELHIQNRVNEELERIHKREAQMLTDVETRLSQVNEPSAEETAAAPTVYSLPELSLESPRVPFAGPGNFRELEALAASGAPVTDPASAATDMTPYRSLTSQSLSQQITDLKVKLAERPRMQGLEPNVQNTRSELVNCLRTHEKRPLMCWKEVEDFKREVGRLQQQWVDKVIG